MTPDIDDTPDADDTPPVAPYIPEALALAQRLGLSPGHPQHVTILHDDWCPLLARTGPCCCDFEVVPGDTPEPPR